MCGRTCCTLSPELVPYACTVVTKGRQVPEWRDAPCGGHYSPSTNVPPTAYTPILFKPVNIEEDEKCPNLVVQPMLWGLVPFWHHGQLATDHKLTTNNARLEGLRESKLYKPLLEQDRRCVVICDGFYEWQKLKSGGGGKQPYFVYAPQKDYDGSTVAKAASENLEDNWSETEGWYGTKPLFMAGLYSVWYADSDRETRQKPVYNYTIITRDSNSTLEWLHDRMPAILADEEAVSAWLSDSLHGLEALDALQPVQKSQVTWHPVSRDVGNVRNKREDLHKKVDIGGEEHGGKSGLSEADKKSRSLMENWLKKGSSGPSPKRGKRDEEDESSTN